MNNNIAEIILQNLSDRIHPINAYAATRGAIDEDKAYNTLESLVKQHKIKKITITLPDNSKGQLYSLQR